jgi:hypothetical protein
VNKNDTHQQNDVIEKARRLSDEAVTLKSKNLAEAVKVMEEVVEMHPLDKYLARLAYYYHLSGKNKECLALHKRRLNQIDSSDALNYHSYCAAVYDDLRKFYARECEYEEALEFQCLAEWHRQVGLACQGKLSADMIKNWKPLEGKNAFKAFKELDNLDKIDFFRSKFKSIFDIHFEILNELSVISKSLNFADERLKKESLYRNDRFLNMYQKLLNENFEETYEKSLAPILSDK